MNQPKFGASFSLIRCRELGLDPQRVLLSALKELGLRRFRLMSYWNVHEPHHGVYNFDELDRQFELVNKYGGRVTLAVGKRQPRWPECHIPDWALALPRPAWYEALYAYIDHVVRRYKDDPALESYQLENEALLKSFGDCKDKDYNRSRLQHELERIKAVDGTKPVIMTFSDSWGFPFRGPVPDVYATSLYRITVKKNGQYSYSKRPPLFYEMRAAVVSTARRRPVFIHELQAEPWVKQAIASVPIDEQLRYMNTEILHETLQFARNTNLSPIDLWGLEWWYWLREHGNAEIWNAIRSEVNSTI
jgi:hypothetical protein